MSRYEEKTREKIIAYGIDHACGPFVLVFLADDDENPIVDLDEFFDQMTVEGVIQVAEQHGAKYARERLTHDNS